MPEALITTSFSQTVFLSPGEPTVRFEDLLIDPMFEDKVQYIRGSPLQSKDLLKARLHDAKAVFVLTSQYTDEVGPPHPAALSGAVLSFLPGFQIVATDATAILMVKAIKSSCPWIPVFCQLISPMSRVSSKFPLWDRKSIILHRSTTRQIAVS